MTADRIHPTDTEETAAAPADPPVGAAGMTGFWRRAAGTAAIVAVLIVGNSAQASAATRSPVRAMNSALSTAPGPTSRVAWSARPSDAARVAAGPAASGAQGPGDGVTDASVGAALHGEFSVLNRDGSTQLRRWQSGQVDALDSVSLTVLSADGFNSRYLLGPGVSVTGIGVGDEVTVVGAGQAVSVGP